MKLTALIGGLLIAGLASVSEAKAQTSVHFSVDIGRPAPQYVVYEPYYYHAPRPVIVRHSYYQPRPVYYTRTHYVRSQPRNYYHSSRYYYHPGKPGGHYKHFKGHGKGHH